MSLRKVTPCDISGICPYNAEVSSTCEYWCGEEEPEENHEEDLDDYVDYMSNQPMSDGEEIKSFFDDGSEV